MGKRLAIYLGLLGAVLALAALGFARLGASPWDRPDSGWLWREVTGKANPASGPRTGDDWIHFDWSTFVDTQGNVFSAGQVYVAQEPWQAKRQPIVRKAYVGILCKLTVPGWKSILHGTKGQAFAVDVHLLRWVNVWRTGVGGQQR
jgi:hypothetical protein